MAKRFPKRLAPALLVPLLTGCVMPDQLSRIEKDLADVRQQLHQMEQEQAEAMDRLAAIQSRGGDEDESVKRADLADLDFRVDQAARQSATTQQQLAELTREFSRIAENVRRNQDLVRRGGVPMAIPLSTEGDAGFPQEGFGANPGLPDAAATGAAAGGQAARTAAPEPEELYNTAYADFSKGNYALAVAGFEEYFERYRDRSQADNALYWVGECHYSQGDFTAAIRAFDRMLSTFPASDKAAAGNLKKALAFLEQNQVSQAIVQLQHVVGAYPSSDEARIARDKLTSLGAPVS